MQMPLQDFFGKKSLGFFVKKTTTSFAFYGFIVAFKVTKVIKELRRTAKGGGG
jgi:hypothetical protein